MTTTPQPPGRLGGCGALATAAKGGIDVPADSPVEK
jgi:hypothetical protein